MASEPLPPRQYAEQVLGKAASPEQLDELFELHAAAHPLVNHGKLYPKNPRDPAAGRLPCCTVFIYSANPAIPGRSDVIARGRAICNPEDQWNRRLGVTIAFGRALKDLRARADFHRSRLAAEVERMQIESAPAGPTDQPDGTIE